jgi:hypothetical protein
MLSWRGCAQLVSGHTPVFPRCELLGAFTQAGMGMGELWLQVLKL